MEKNEVYTNGVAQRKVLNMTVSSILTEIDFDTVDRACLETLTEMLQSLIVEIGQQSRNYCELGGRTIPVVGDVLVALINMGIKLNGIEKFAKRESRQIIPQPQQISQQKQLNLLQAGTKHPHPSYIPNYLPVLPDPHAYIRTPTHKQPVTEYEAIREKAANQKRDIEKALTKFLAKTSDTQSLFDTEDTMFPLIACKPSFPSYLAALNPTDQVFDFEELEYHYLVANRTEDVTSKENDNESGNEDENDETNNKDNKQDKESSIKNDTTATQSQSVAAIAPSSSSTATATAQEMSNIKQSAINTAILNNPNIDNPYLRAATLPKKGRSEPLSGLYGI